MDLDNATREDLISHIRDLRTENASRRTTLRAYEEAFGAYDEDTRNGLLNIVTGLSNDDARPEVAKLLRDISHDILGEEFLEGAEWADELTKTNGEEDTEVDEETKALIAEMRAEIQELKGRSDAEAEARSKADEAEVQAILDEAKALGYTEGSMEMQHLFYVAMNDKDVAGDLRKAAEKIAPITGIEVPGAEGGEGKPKEGEGEGEGEGGTGDEGKEGAGDGTPRFPSTARSNASAPGLQKAEAPESFADAEKALYAFLDSAD